MILQELLRNIVLYKGVIRPVLQAWKEAIWLQYVTVNSQVVAKNQYTTALISEAISQSSRTGTLTIPSYILSINDTIFRNRTIQRTILTTVGNNSYIMLAGVRVEENAVTSSITDFSCSDLCLDKAGSAKTAQRSLTTGSIIENLYLYLSETHEERELLGGFSLSHEGNPLMYLTRGGE